MPGGPQKSFDKQLLIDYILPNQVGKNPLAQEWPEKIIKTTQETS